MVVVCLFQQKRQQVKPRVKSQDGEEERTRTNGKLPFADYFVMGLPSTTLFYALC